MRTAVDSSVLLDVLADDPAFAERSEGALRTAMASGALVIGECVLAEISPAFKPGDVEQFLSDWCIEFVPMSRASALLAGEMFQRYLTRRRKGGVPRVVPDFLVGAHAAEHADRLLARDRGFYRDYFEKLSLMQP